MTLMRTRDKYPAAAGDFCIPACLWLVDEYSDNVLAVLLLDSICRVMPQLHHV